MNEAKVLLAVLTECQSAGGNVYLRGWLGASNLVGFRGEPYDQGRPTWNLYLVERQPREGGQASARRPQEHDGANSTANRISWHRRPSSELLPPRTARERHRPAGAAGAGDGRAPRRAQRCRPQRRAAVLMPRLHRHHAGLLPD